MEGMKGSIRPLSAFEDLAKKWGEILYNKNRQDTDKVTDLKTLMKSCGLLLGRTYQEVRLGKQILYVFDMPSKGERKQKLLLHGFSVVGDDDFLKGYQNVLYHFENNGIDAPLWPLPDDVVTYIARNSRSGGVLEI